MYRVVYTKRAVKDIKNLKSAKLDNMVLRQEKVPVKLKYFI